MKVRRFAGLVVAGWFLMIAPPKVAGNHFRTNFAAPLSQWVQLRLFRSLSQCEIARKAYQQHTLGGLPAVLNSRQQAQATMDRARCITSDDPSLRQH